MYHKWCTTHEHFNLFGLFFCYFNNNTCTWIYKNAQTTNNIYKCKQYDRFCLTHKIIMQYVMSNDNLHFTWFPTTHALYCQVLWIWTTYWNMLKSLYTPLNLINVELTWYTLMTSRSHWIVRSQLFNTLFNLLRTWFVGQDLKMTFYLISDFSYCYPWVNKDVFIPEHISSLPNLETSYGEYNIHYSTHFIIN